MKNKLLAFWDKKPNLEIRLEPVFPLAKATGIPKAFKDEKLEKRHWEMLRKHYGPEGIFINYGTPLEWREEIITFETSELEKAVKNYSKHSKKVLVLNGKKLDSFTLQAQVKGIVDGSSYSRTGLYCFTQSPDKSKLIMGIRGGSNNIGRIISSPVGHVAYKETPEYDNQITDAVILEGHEEMGMRKSDIEKIYPVGLFRQAKEVPGNIFFYISQLKIPAEEIIERHTEAMIKYNAWKEEKDGDKMEKEIYARKKMAEQAGKDDTFPVDAWENKTLITIPNDPDYIIKKIGSLIQMDSMPGSLALYFLHEFEESYAKLMDSTGFKKRVLERF